MKIESVKMQHEEHPLNLFKTGDCIRLVRDGICTRFLNCVYIVVEGGRVINLFSGVHRDDGWFVLEPNAKVVIE